MFTSGSTGEPKGVTVPHRAQANCPVQTIETCRVTGADRGPAVAALHPFLSVFDLSGLLAARGSVAVPAAGDRRDPAHRAATRRPRPG